MKKSSFIALILGTVSGVLFALGMCMALLPEWNAFTEGVIFGAVGIVLGMITALIWCKMENKKLPKMTPSVKAFHSGRSAIHIPSAKSTPLTVPIISAKKLLFFILKNSFKPTLVFLLQTYYNIFQKAKQSTIKQQVLE